MNNDSITQSPPAAQSRALVQFRREVAAGLRRPNDPTDALWRAAWRQLAASCWRLVDHPSRAAFLSREAAQIIVSAAQQKRVGRSS